MSRLECKDCTDDRNNIHERIRICPDWNVKAAFTQTATRAEQIRICPDWNVKRFA